MLFTCMYISWFHVSLDLPYRFQNGTDTCQMGVYFECCNIDIDCWLLFETGNLWLALSNFLIWSFLHASEANLGLMPGSSVIPVGRASFVFEWLRNAYGRIPFTFSFDVKCWRCTKNLDNGLLQCQSRVSFQITQMHVKLPSIGALALIL